MRPSPCISARCGCSFVDHQIGNPLAVEPGVSKEDLVQTVRSLTEQAQKSEEDDSESDTSPDDENEEAPAKATLPSAGLSVPQPSHSLPTPDQHGTGTVLGQEDLQFIDNIFTSLEGAEKTSDAPAFPGPLGTQEGAAPIGPVGPEEKLTFLRRKLKERERSVVVMTFYDEQTSADVASFLGLSEANVRVIRHRAIHQLRECMGVAV